MAIRFFISVTIIVGCMLGQEWGVSPERNAGLVMLMSDQHNEMDKACQTVSCELDSACQSRY